MRQKRNSQQQQHWRPALGSVAARQIPKLAPHTAAARPSCRSRRCRCRCACGHPLCRRSTLRHCSALPPLQLEPSACCSSLCRNRSPLCSFHVVCSWMHAISSWMQCRLSLRRLSSLRRTIVCALCCLSTFNRQHGIHTYLGICAICFSACVRQAKGLALTCLRDVCVCLYVLSVTCELLCFYAYTHNYTYLGVVF